MNQQVPHSNHQPLTQAKSQTSQRLYQHPTAAEMQSKNNTFGNVCAGLLLFILAGGMGYMMGVASDKEAVAKVQAMEASK